MNRLMIRAYKFFPIAYPRVSDGFSCLLNPRKFNRSGGVSLNSINNALYTTSVERFGATAIRNQEERIISEDFLNFFYDSKISFGIASSILCIDEMETTKQHILPWNVIQGFRTNGHNKKRNFYLIDYEQNLEKEIKLVAYARSFDSKRDSIYDFVIFLDHDDKSKTYLLQCVLSTGSRVILQMMYNEEKYYLDLNYSISREPGEEMKIIIDISSFDFNKTFLVSSNPRTYRLPDPLLLEENYSKATSWKESSIPKSDPLYFIPGKILTGIIYKDAGPKPENQDVQVKSNMNSRVVKVACNKDQSVEKGDTIVVLESMKMEISVTSPCKGIISAINCHSGDSIQEGEVLFSVSQNL